MAILSSPAVWALVIAEIGFDWGSYTIVNDLPKYMNDVLRFSVEEVSFTVFIVNNFASKYYFALNVFFFF